MQNKKKFFGLLTFIWFSLMLISTGIGVSINDRKHQVCGKIKEKFPEKRINKKKDPYIVYLVVIYAEKYKNTAAVEIDEPTFISSKLGDTVCFELPSYHHIFDGCSEIEKVFYPFMYAALVFLLLFFIFAYQHIKFSDEIK